MKKILLAMKPYLSEIINDFMMIACLLVPILMGLAFKIGIPLLEKFICIYFSKTEIITPYFMIFDLFVAIMTPMMFTFAGVMTVLTELDNGTAKYLCVTPIGKTGYIFSRIVIPAILAFVYSFVLLMIFSLTKLNLLMNVTVSFLSTIFGIAISLFVISFAKNKLEGMALVKLCGLLIFGIPVVYFIPDATQYLFSVLPSFWIAKIANTNNYFFVLPAIAVSSIWICLIDMKFKKRLL